MRNYLIEHSFNRYNYYIFYNNYEAFMYSFSYTDPTYAEDFFSEVIWIKNNDIFYVLNIEIVLSNYENNKDLINSIINSFTII